MPKRHVAEEVGLLAVEASAVTVDVQEEEPVDLAGIVREISADGAIFTLKELRDLLEDYGITLEGNALVAALKEAQRAIVDQDEARGNVAGTWVRLGRSYGFSTPRYGYALPPSSAATSPTAIEDETSIPVARSDQVLRSPEITHGIALWLPPGLYEDTGASLQQELDVIFALGAPGASMVEADIVTSLVRRTTYSKSNSREWVRRAAEDGLLITTGRAGKQRLLRLPEADDELEASPDTQIEPEQQREDPTFTLLTNAVIDHLTGPDRAQTLKQLRLIVAADTPVSVFNPIVRSLQRNGIVTIQTTPSKGVGFKSPRIALTDDALEIIRGASDIAEARQFLKELAGSTARG